MSVTHSPAPDRVSWAESEAAKKQMRKAERFRRVMNCPTSRQMSALVVTVRNTGDALRAMVRTHGMKCRCRFCTYMRNEEMFPEDFWKDLALLDHAIQLIGSAVECALPVPLVYPDEEE